MQDREQCFGVLAGGFRRMDRAQDVLRVETDLLELFERRADFVCNEVTTGGTVGEPTESGAHSGPLRPRPVVELLLTIHAFDGPTTVRARPTEFRVSRPSRGDES